MGNYLKKKFDVISRNPKSHTYCKSLLASWIFFFFFRALHWVTIQMLCVPVDEEIPEVSDSVVKAITGGSAKNFLDMILSFTCFGVLSVKVHSEKTVSFLL